MIAERQRPGVAIVTARPLPIKALYGDAGLPSRPLLVQPGPSWPAHHALMVLDTIDLPASELVILLADPPQANWPPPATMRSGLRAKPNYLPLIAFARPNDWRTLRLLSLCSSVRLICPGDPTQLARWVLHIEAAIAARSGLSPTAWLVEPPTDLKLDPLLLPALAVLPYAASLRIAAERCGVSESALARMLRITKATLGLPPGDVCRFRPDELAALILERLGLTH